jgi:hypothetical protein
MAFCTNCGTEMSDAAAACPQCGHPRALGGAGRRTEGSAIAALVLGIAGIVVCPLVPSIIAIIVGSQARTKIANDPSLEGEGLAKTGVILGWVGIGLAVLGIIAAVLLFVVGGGTTTGDFDFNV